MKKGFLCLLLFGLCLPLSACRILPSTIRNDDIDDRTPISNSSAAADDTEDSSADDENSNTIVKEFGSYTLPDGWEESVSHSTKDRFFYVENGKDNEAVTNNFSVNEGQNKYAEDDHMDFRDAIMSQLSSQLSSDPNATLSASGSTTEHDYILYTFTIGGEDDGRVSTQFYIVGEQKYCMIYLTNFDASEEADQAAKTVVDSFVWAE